MILLIDNYDSFTFNLVQFFGDLGADCVVKRNDALSAQDVLAMRPEAVVLSPGPCTPNEAGICLDMVQAAAEARLPLFGVCLGHQAIGQAFGGQVVRAPEPVHGKTSPVFHDNTGVFEGLPNPFTATRYHSLIVQRAEPARGAAAHCLDGGWHRDGAAPCGAADLWRAVPSGEHRHLPRA